MPITKLKIAGLILLAVLMPKDEPSSLTAPFGEEQAKAAQEACAKSLGKSSPVETNSIGMELVLIPPGKFTMGTPASERGRESHEDQVEVTLTKSFYLGKTEVTRSQWQTVMGTTPWLGKQYVKEGNLYPATYVNWEDARAFCQKLSELEKTAYRLPTEAEWEYACRGGTTTPFSFGDDESKLSDYAWWGGVNGAGNAKGEPYSHEVRQKKANPFALYDMHGNVWEWCEDVYTEKLPGGTDPLVSAAGFWGMERSGVWSDVATYCRSGDRHKIPRRSRNGLLGFRVVLNSGN